MLARICRHVVALALCAASATLGAQTFPAGPIKVVIPSGAGAGMDIMGRLVSNHALETFGQPMVIDNKPGASTIIAAKAVATAPPDGLTLLLTNSTTHHQNPVLMKSLSYDPIKDFVPVSEIVSDAGIVLVCNPNVPAKNVKELMAYVKTHPGEVNYGSIGLGTTYHIWAELLAKKFGLRMTHVPYKSSPAMEVDLLSGRVQFSFLGPQVAGPYRDAGKVRILGVTGTRRMPSLPDVPTFKEQGVDGFEATASITIFAPAGTPPEVVSKLATGISSIVARPDVSASLLKIGNFPSVSDEKVTAQKFAREHELWRAAIEASGVSLDQ